MNSLYLNKLSTALNAYSMRSEAISNNIANVNTPNYKRKYIKFEEYLSKASNDLTLKGARTNQRHLEIPPVRGAYPSVVVDNSVSTREDGNNVNLDTEEIDSVKNYINYSMVADSLTGYFASMISGITGGRK